MPRQDAWQAVVGALKAEGVARVYGIPGSPRFLYDALYDTPEIKAVLVRHEAAGAFMAYAESRLTGKPAVCFASPGPGVSNLVAGILEAYSACLPIILLATGTSSRLNGMGAFQEADQISVFRPITKWAVRVERAELVPWTMRRAFSLATTGKPGPVYVEIPSDIALEAVEMPRYAPCPPPAPPAAESRAVSQAVDLLLAAKNPVLMAGGGAYLASADAEVRDLAELLGLPILTSVSGRGIIPETHPQALGMTGLYFNPLSYRAYSEADVMLSAGCRHEEFTSGSWQYYPPGLKLIQIDIDPYEFGRNFVPALAMMADAKLALAAIADEVRRRGVDSQPVADRKRQLAKMQQEYVAEVEEECRTEDLPIKTKRVVWELGQVFREDTILANENGSQDLWSYYYPYYRVPTGGRAVVPAEQTCMGLGVVGAIAAKMVYPNKKVVCTTGDGAFQMYMQDLPTAVQYGAPVTWVVLNNSCLGWPKLASRTSGHRYLAVDFESQPDFVQLAAANQCYGERIEQPADIRPALERALEANRRGVPSVLEFVVGTWDYAWGFKEYYRRVGALPADME